MKIEISDNTRMQSALDKVYEGKFFDALCLFARVDSYESMLNQIGCLCHLRDTGYAVELYRRLLAKYHFTHNCHADVCKLSTQTARMMTFFDDKMKSDYFDSSKISAEEELLGEFELPDEYDDLDDLEELLADEMEEAFESNFVEVGSPEHFFKIIKRLQEESEKGRIKKSKATIDELLKFDSTNESVLEGQMLLCIAERDYKKGAEFAEKFAQLEHCESYRATAVAVGILFGLGERSETLDKLLKQLINFAEEITDDDLIEYVEIAESRFENDELTGKLATILYKRANEIGCEAFRICSRIFCNLGWKKQAKDALLTLANAVPWDSYAQVMLTYVDTDLSTKLDKAYTNLDLARHLDVPTQLAVIAEYRLVARMEQAVNGESDCFFSTDDYAFLHCIANVCKTHAYRGNSEKFVNDATVLATLLATFQPQNKTEFYDFAKQQLCSFMPEAPVQKDILFSLIKHGYRDRLLITVGKTYYSLDLGKLTVDDEIFLHAFCLCAALHKVETRRLERNYLKIKQAVGEAEFSDGEFSYTRVHNLAYCLLAVSFKDFAQSQLANYFSESEHSLYLKYLASLE